ncbi:MAG TPA: hypothetical protein VEZ15_17060, partial [Acidimicrobiia bacterium]|nr:hypothetical protein [Acidimicrobiia bacterium]
MHESLQPQDDLVRVDLRLVGEIVLVSKCRFRQFLDLTARAAHVSRIDLTAQRHAVLLDYLVKGGHAGWRELERGGDDLNRIRVVDPLIP